MKRHPFARIASLTGVGLVVAACGPLSAQRYDRCEIRRDVELDLPVNGIQLLDVTAKSGSLDIEGSSTARAIQVTATICASDEDRMDGLDVSLERSGSRAVLETIFPDNNRSWNNGYAHIDVVVTVPTGLDARVVDGSGHANISGVGALNVDDGSGHLVLRDIGGDVNIEDGSGHVEVFDVTGSVRIDDGSGAITISGVDGSVTLEDGSGSVDIDDVTRDVNVTDKGSGTIDVRDVQGDLSVAGTRRERIRYDNVAGSLDLPAPRRRGRRGN
jgi:hypothetical protein